MSSSPSVRWITWSWLACAFVLAFSVNLLTLRDKGWLEQPPDPGDSQDYYNIAVNVLAGRGFGVWWDDPQFRAYYQAHNDDFRFSGILRRHGGYKPTTYRPPLLPLAMAGVFAIAGPDLTAWLWVDSALVAAAVALAALLALRVSGHLAAGLTTLLGSFDPARAVFAPAVMTEGLAMLGVVGLAWLLVRLIDRQRAVLALGAGAITGALVLNRSAFLLWCPLLAALVAWLWRRSKGSVWLAVGLFLLPAIALPAPWWVRNCLVLDRFMPFGTQAGVGLPLGYSDLALESGGLWSSSLSNRFWTEARNEIEARGLEPLTGGVRRASFGQRQVLRWIAEHPTAVPVLAWRKAWNAWTWTPRYGWLLLAALPGLWLVRRRPEVQVAWALLAINTLGIAATYWALGRFLIPVVPVLDLLAAVGVCTVLGGLAGRSRLGRKLVRLP